MMKMGGSEEMPCETSYEEGGRCYATHFKETEWNGTPAYIKYVRDITEEATVKREKERLEKYFETVLKYLPGGVAVVHHGLNGRLTPEYLSDGLPRWLICLWKKPGICIRQMRFQVSIRMIRNM